MTAAAREVHDRSGRSAGNGSLMRTGPVALAYLDDPDGLVEAAMAVSALTHHQDLAQEACAVWCLMIRHAVLHGEFPTYDDIAPWVPNPDRWRGYLSEAEAKPPSSFAQNGWSVGALQAAWSAITHTPEPTDGPACGHLVDSLGTAIRIGHDTDTVAAIAGALLGARWGMSAVPAAWRRLLHGWPGIDGRELEQLAFLIARGGEAGKYGWPLVDHIDYTDLQYGEPGACRAPVRRRRAAVGRDRAGRRTGLGRCRGQPLPHRPRAGRPAPRARHLPVDGLGRSGGEPQPRLRPARRGALGPRPAR